MTRREVRGHALNEYLVLIDEGDDRLLPRERNVLLCDEAEPLLHLTQQVEREMPEFLVGAENLLDSRPVAESEQFDLFRVDKDEFALFTTRGIAERCNDGSDYAGLAGVRGSCDENMRSHHEVDGSVRRDVDAEPWAAGLEARVRNLGWRLVSASEYREVFGRVPFDVPAPPHLRGGLPQHLSAAIFVTVGELGASVADSPADQVSLGIEPDVVDGDVAVVPLDDHVLHGVGDPGRDGRRAGGARDCPRRGL